MLDSQVGHTGPQGLEPKIIRSQPDLVMARAWDCGTAIPNPRNPNPNPGMRIGLTKCTNHKI